MIKALVLMQTDFALATLYDVFLLPVTYLIVTGFTASFDQHPLTKIAAFVFNPYHGKGAAVR